MLPITAQIGYGYILFMANVKAAQIGPLVPRDIVVVVLFIGKNISAQSRLKPSIYAGIGIFIWQSHINLLQKNVSKYKNLLWKSVMITHKSPVKNVNIHPSSIYMRDWWIWTLVLISYGILAWSYNIYIYRHKAAYCW